MKTHLKKFFSNYWVLLLLVVLKFVLQWIVVNPLYELHRDEFLHLDQANHLAWGFISVPPLTSVISKMILLLGGGLFWVRFFPALFGALTIVFTWLIVETLEGNLFAKILASCAVLFSVMVRLNILFQPNAFDILTWTILFYLIINYFKSGKSKWLFVFAIISVLGLYNKYTTGFLLVSLALGILISPERQLFGKRSFWIAIIILVGLFIPNIIWQVNNHFPVIGHMKVLKANQLDNNSSVGFLFDQLKFIAGSVLLILSAILAFIKYKPFRNYRSAGIAVLFVLSLFTILKAKNYYAFGLYPFLFAAGSVYFEKILSEKSRKIIFPILISANLITFLVTFTLVYPVYSPEQIRKHAASFEKMGMLRWEDGKNHQLPQDFSDMLGWKEIADKALLAYNMIPPNENKQVLVYADNYGQAGAVNYYNRETSLPECYSFCTDYIFWIPESENYKYMILIGNEPSNEVKALFSDIRLVGSVENEYAREKGTGIYLFKGASSKFSEAFYEIRKDRIDKNDIY
jgi:hypothetical protein